MKFIKKIVALLLMAVPIMILLSSCNASGDTVVFKKKNIVNRSFDGVGIEWDVYENPYLINEHWETITNRVDNLSPAIVRCMLNMEWYMYLDIQNDNEIIYNFNGVHLKNLYKILDYCEQKGITVALGVWGYPGGFFMEEQGGIAAPLFAQSFAKLFQELITNKKYTCVRYAVVGNEPNLWYNLYDDAYTSWTRAVTNVHAEFAQLGLSDVLTIAGPDTTGIEGSVEWVTNLEKDKTLRDKLSIYEVHGYIPDYYILTGSFAKELREFANTKQISKTIHMWEAGLFDGKTAANNQMRIRTYEYGLLMTDYTIQTLMAGFSSIVYWQLDDAMHFNATGGTFLWGMFNTIGTADDYQLRPWYHAMSLMGRCIEKDMTIMSSSLDDENFRAVSGVSPDKKKASIVAVNHKEEEVTKTFRFGNRLKTGKDIYIYLFNEDDLQLDSNGYVIPNKVVSGVNLNKKTTITIPPKTAIFITTEKLDTYPGGAQ